jgi:hypothetical protein
MAADTESAPTLKFAVGTFVVMKVLDVLGEHVKTHVKQHFRKHVATHKHIYTTKVKIAVGVVAVAALAGTWYYYKQKKLKEKLAADAATAALANQVGVSDVIADAMPEVNVTLWG